MTIQDYEVVDVTRTAYYAVGLWFPYISVLASSKYSKKVEIYEIWLNYQYV